MRCLWVKTESVIFFNETIYGNETREVNDKSLTTVPELPVNPQGAEHNE